MQKYLLSLFCLIAMSSVVAGPGYVSRDCAAAGARESITLDWSNIKNYFYTVSLHAKKTSSSPYYRWVPYYNSANGLYEMPGNNPTVRKVVYTEKSHAGIVGNYREYYNGYYKGVYGIHYWFNENARRWENRRAFVTSCNSGSIGYNNW